MLLSLAIRDIVLIERLDLEFAAGLTVLTGETGAGKSIMLDALGLALGERGDSGLVRHGAEQAVVAAEFSLGADHPALSIIDAAGLAAPDTVAGETLVLRRVLGRDGRSRGFVNDQPAGIGVMSQVAGTLLEIQGQFDRHGLMNPASHRHLLDAFAGAAPALASVRTAWTAWQAAIGQRAAASAAIAKTRADEALLRHMLTELDEARPLPGEEAALAAERTRLMAHAQLAEAIETATQYLAGAQGAEASVNHAARAIERVQGKAAGSLDAAADALARAAIELQEAASLLAVAQQADAERADPDAIEARLFALRALARKYGREVDALAAYRDEIAQQLAAINESDQDLRALAAAEQHLRGAYQAASFDLTRLRKAAIPRLEHAIATELAPLKLDRARFRVALSPVEEDGWGPDGAERIAFEVATNPGAPLGPLNRIASGGELARLLLAFKVVLAGTSDVATLVFDEVDAGVGGAVADAVGDRLSRLGRELQVLVVTHSPQVAARGDHHWTVTKSIRGNAVATSIGLLSEPARQEEIARMLSGAQITDEARAAAARLLRAGV